MLNNDSGDDAKEIVDKNKMVDDAMQNRNVSTSAYFALRFLSKLMD